MKIKAIWIIDHEYIVPACLSISSFLADNDIPILVVFCGDQGDEKAKSLFTGLSKNISFEQFFPPKTFEKHPQKGIITNRLARMHYSQNNDNEIILLFDADTLFARESKSLIEAIKSEYEPDQSIIFGVLDAKIAYRDYLYFRTQDANGRDVVVPHLQQKDIYNDVFGKNWWHHLKGASINNGVVAFYNCKSLVDRWKEYYLRGLEHEYVNPGDDQLPLAAAIHKTAQKVVCLPDRFNSKGNVSGDYVVYHALSSTWKMQLFAAYNKIEGASEFADIARNYLTSLPPFLLDEFVQSLRNPEPFLFRKLKGKFGFRHLYEDAFSGLDEGVVVEVGMHSGKSACFMAEQIRNSGKDIHFYTLDIPRNRRDTQEFEQVIQEYGLTPFVQRIDPSQKDLIIEKHGKLDFVFLNLGNDYDVLYTNLAYWYSNLKPGGILAGYDYTSQIGLEYGNNCATYNFCKKEDLSLRISFNIFIIQKPFETDKEVMEEEANLVLHNSNIGI